MISRRFEMDPSLGTVIKRAREADTYLAASAWGQGLPDRAYVLRVAETLIEVPQ